MKKMRSQQGSAMIAALMMVAVLTAGAALVWQAMHQDIEAGRAEARIEGAYHLAEAGIDHAIASLRNNDAFEGASEVNLGDGSFSSQVTRLDTTQSFRIASTGHFPPSVTLTLEAHVRFGLDGTVTAFLLNRPEAQR